MKWKNCFWIFVVLNAFSLFTAHSATVSWTNTSGGLWSAPINWDTHFTPRPFDAVAITVPGNYTVTVDTNVTATTLSLGGASGTQTVTNASLNMAITNILVGANGVLAFGGGTLAGTGLTNQGNMIWGGGTWSISSTMSASAILKVTGGLNLTSPITNQGTINWTAGSISVANNAGIYTGAFYNQTGGYFNVQGDLSLYSSGYGSEWFRNAGTVRKLSGAGATSFSLFFTNTGAVDAQSGTINFSSGGNIGGSYSTTAGTVIQFTSGNYLETGSVTSTGTGTFRENGANVTLNDRIPRFILLAGNVSLSPTFQGSGAIQNLQLDGAYLIGTNRVTGTLGFNGGGMGGSSSLTVTAAGVLDFNGAPVNIYSPVTNAGTINWSGGSVTLANNAGIYTGAVYNQAGGILNAQNDQNFGSAGYGYEFFSNSGMVRKIAGLAATSFGLPFTNNGTVDCQSGFIQFTGGGNIGGTYNTASGTTIQFIAGAYTETGPVSVTGSGLCRQNGANVTLNDRVANLLLYSGNVALTPGFQASGSITNLQLDGASLIGTNRVTGTLGLNGSAIASASPLTVMPGGTLNFNGGAVNIYAPITNNGTINWSSGSVSLANNAAIYTGVVYIQPGGLFNVQCDQNFGSAGYGSEFFSNAGTVRKVAGLGTTTFSLPFTNLGTVDAQSGTIQFNGGGNIDGTYNTASNATIQMTAGNYVETGTVTSSGTGLFRQNGANVTLNNKITNFILTSGNVTLSPTFQGSGAIQTLQLDGAFLTGTNRVAGTLGFNGGGMASASPLTILASGALNLNGAAVTIYAPLTNLGTINWSSGSISVANNAGIYTGVIYNQPGGTFVFQSDQNLGTAGYGFESFNSSGVIRKTAGLGQSTIGLAFVNSGTLDAQAGTIRINGPYSQNGGTMNFGITSLAYFGQISFASVAPLTGALSANFNGGYFPNAGDSFNLMTYGSRSGIFTSQSLPPEAQWQTNYSATTFTLTVLSATGLTPVSLTPVSLASGKFTIQINGSVGPQYVLQASTNLVNWSSILTNTPATTPFSVVDTNAGSFGRRFYRVLLQ